MKIEMITQKNEIEISDDLNEYGNVAQSCEKILMEINNTLKNPTEEELVWANQGILTATSMLDRFTNEVIIKKFHYSEICRVLYEKLEKKHEELENAYQSLSGGQFQ